ncbi:alpha/beta fold hydrolase [Streptomyces vilmorinianum]|uniref:alpha/beta fold hydrolase n=1 Tax=Streptomyces vilmorinianum TaxID=3051092 RepID=UPI0010FB087C|nr:alpha/beta hydrolase [Streptomyces vilmorinianum]
MDELNSTLSRSRGRVTSGDGTRIAYERCGEGEPVIVVSGALCTGAAERPLAALLAPRFSVVTYDRRGRGGSGDTRPYTVEREIDDLAALIDEMGGHVSVHGMSSGGALALAATEAGLPIRQLSVYEPPYSSEAGAGSGAPSGSGARDAFAALELFLSETAVQVPPQLEAVAHTLAYDHAVLGDGTVPAARLGRIHARVLVVDGGASPARTRRAALAVSAALPRGRHRTLTGQTHMVAPHVLAPVLEDFYLEE